MTEYKEFKTMECEPKPEEPTMDFIQFKNLVSEKAGLLEGKIVRIADGLVGTTDEEISSLFSERAKITDMFTDEDNKTSHTFMNFLHFLFSRLEITRRMVDYLGAIVIKLKDDDATCCDSEPCDPIFSPMDAVLNDICIYCGYIITGLFSISNKFKARKCEDSESPVYDTNCTEGILKFINFSLAHALDLADEILMIMYGVTEFSDEVKCGCEGD